MCSITQAFFSLGWKKTIMDNCVIRHPWAATGSFRIDSSTRGRLSNGTCEGSSGMAQLPFLLRYSAMKGEPDRGRLVAVSGMVSAAAGAPGFFRSGSRNISGNRCILIILLTEFFAKCGVLMFSETMKLQRVIYMAQPVFDPKNEWEEILKKDAGEAEAPNADSEGMKEGVKVKKEGISFNLKPEELESYLNQYVVGQEDAIEVIATKVCTHFNRMKIEKMLPEDQKILGNIKSNMLMIGSTGVGKTYIVKLIAQKIGVPFVKADATKFSETGYVGGDVEDLIRELVQEADGDISKAEYGIVYLDEIDKIASSGNMTGPDVSRTGVQRNLLKIMEEAEVDLKTPHDLASQVEAAMEAQKTGKVIRKKINTRNILFIVSGAFSGLDKIVRKRMNMQAIGFDNAHDGRVVMTNSDILKKTRTEDLIEYGFESEFVGRLPVMVTLNDVTENTLYQILKNRHSAVVNGKKLDFRAYGIELDFSDGALHKLAKVASTEKTGARALLSVFERVLIRFEKTMPSLETKKLYVDENLVDAPEKVLDELMINDNIKGFQKDFLVNHGIYLEFAHEALELIQEKAKAQRKSIRRVCEDLFHDYPYGIRLMKREHFTIEKDAVQDPAGFLDRYIRENYIKQQESK